MAVDEKVLVLLGLGLLDLSAGVDILGGLEGTVGVVLAYLVKLLLVVENLADQLANLRQGRRGGLLGRQWREKDERRQGEKETCQPDNASKLHEGETSGVSVFGTRQAPKGIMVLDQGAVKRAASGRNPGSPAWSML